ncbi:MAG: OmpA family protein [Elusimicrobiota bacterium]|jgi:predicted outer membrane repeat protein|nr:OmpA family protein [Elusimicrobiota bacterium]
MKKILISIILFLGFITSSYSQSVSVSSWAGFTAAYGDPNFDFINLSNDISAAGDIDAPSVSSITINGAGGYIDGSQFGGFVFSSVQSFFYDITLQNFKRTGAGGVFAADNYSAISFVNTNASFNNNSATTNGAVAYLDSYSNLSFTADLSDMDIQFYNNSANGVENDVYFADDNSELLFSVDNSFTINLTNGIITSGAAGAIARKTGLGVLEFNGVAKIGNIFSIDAGTVVFNVSQSTIYSLNMSVDTVLSMQVGQFNQLFLNSANLSGEIIVDMDFANLIGDYIYAGGGNIGISQSSLSINILGTNQKYGAKILFMQANNISGDFYIDVNLSTSYVMDNLNGQLWIKFIGGEMWDYFAGLYRSATATTGTISLIRDITASNTVIASMSFNAPLAGDNFTVDGANFIVDSNLIENLGFVLSGKQLQFSNINFSQFISASEGAVLRIDSGSNIIFSGTISFNNNSSYVSNGGAIFASDSQIEFNAGGDIIFTGNYANWQPNDIYLDNSQLTLYANAYEFKTEDGINAYNGSKIIYSNADLGFWRLGGSNVFSQRMSFDIGNNSRIFIDNGHWTYTLNTAQISLNYSTMTFTAVRVFFSSNSRDNTGNGSSFNLNSSSLSFINSTVTFSFNTSARRDIGAIYAQNGSVLYFEGSEIFFSSNIMNNGANDIYIDGSALYIVNSPNQVRFESGLYAILQSTFVFNNSASASLYISGDNNFSEMAYFFISPISSITVEKATFTYRLNDFMSLDDSTAAFLKSTLYFSSNTNASDGGAVFLDNSSLILFDSSIVVFSSNTAQNNSGALHLNGLSSASFSYSTVTFFGNTAIQDGGAIAIDDDKLFPFLNSKVSFSSNLSQNDGGAMFMRGGAVLKAAHGIFAWTSNTASNFGGAVNAGFSTISFEYSTISFISNSAFDGGALYIGDSLSSFNFSRIDYLNNTAANFGAAAYIHQNSNINFFYSTISFIGNQSADGGSLYINGSTLTFERSVLKWTSNTASNDGGALFLENSQSSFSLSTINFLSNMSGNFGAAIYSSLSTVSFNISGINMTSNTAVSGAAIYGSRSSFSFNASSALFAFNTADDGAALYFDSSNISFEISTIGFIGNISTNASLYASASNMIFTASTINFIANTAFQDGGGAALYAVSNFDFFNSKIVFTSNNALNGGAVYSEDFSSVSFTSSAVRWLANTAFQGGGAVFIDETASVYITSSIVLFGQNTAVSSGGGAYFGADSSFSIEYSSIDFISNISSADGGAIFVRERAVLSFANTTISFLNNTAFSFGGAIFAQNSANISFSSSPVLVKFINNGAFGGGAVFLDDFSQLSFIDSSAVFSNNFSKSSGGVLYLDNSAQFVFENALLDFVKNTASISGGAIFADNGSIIDFNLSSSVFFTSNTASNGGAFYAQNSAIITFNGSTVSFVFNTASSAAIAYIASNAEMHFSGGDAYFTNNKSTGGDGILYLNGGILDFVNISILKVQKNEALNGGFIFVNGGEFDLEILDEFIFSSNTARGIGGKGGAFYLSGSTLAIVGAGTISYNRAQSSGGFIYAQGSSVSIIAGIGSITAQNNTAANRGNDIYLSSSELHLNAFANMEIKFSKGGIYAIDESFINIIGAGKVNFEGFDYFAGISSFGVINGGLWTVKGSTFTYTANTSGLYISLSTAVFMNSSVTFSSNTASFDGAGLYAFDSEISISSSRIQFTSNTADAFNGGAFYFYNSTLTITITTINFKLNSGNSGGAISLNNNIMSIMKSSISWTSNTAVSTDGGAISVESGYLKISSSVLNFSFNNAASNGGAVFVHISTIDFYADKMTIAGNTAVSGGGFNAADSSVSFKVSTANFLFNIGTDGAGVYLLNGNIESSHSVLTFLRNTAANSGAAVFMDNSSIDFAAASMTISMSSAQIGGGIYMNTSQINLTSSSIHLNSNTALASGGGLYLDMSSIAFKNSTANFTSNKSDLGGALFVSVSTLSFTNSVFNADRNIASSGSAVYLVNAMIDFQKTILSFTNNTALKEGAGFYLDASSIFFNISSMTIRASSAGANGGAFFLSNFSEITFSSVSILLNSNIALSSGGAFYFQNSSASFIGSTIVFRANKSASGGVFYLDGSFLSIESSKIDISSASADLGAVFYLTNSSASIKGFGNISYNQFNSSGGAFYADGGSNIKLLTDGGDLVFKGNKTSRNAPNDFFLDSSFLTLESAQNRQIRLEDGIYAVNASEINITSRGLVYMSGINYFNAVSSFVIIGGGIVSVENASWTYTQNGMGIYIENSTIVFNKAVISFSSNGALTTLGGALYSIGSVLKIENKGASFIGNIAVNDGGALYAQNSTITINAGGDIIFRENNAANGRDNLNDIYLDNSILMMSAGAYAFSMEGGIISTNSFISYKGALNGLYLENEMNLAASTISFINNTAPSDGASLSAQSVLFSFDNSSASWISNKADYGFVSASKGGAAYIMSSTMSWTNSRGFFVNNIAGKPASLGISAGGAIYAYDLKFDFDGSTIVFLGNSANSGGALYLENSSISFINSSSASFINNFASNTGGAIFAVGSTISFGGAFITFAQNSANQGGAVYSADGEINIIADISSIVFINNSARSGADIYVSNSVLNLLVNGNTIVLQGGIYAANQSSITILGQAAGGNEKIILGGNNYFERMASFNISNVQVEGVQNTFSYVSNTAALNISNSSVLFSSIQAAFNSNVSNGTDGGALYIDNSSISFSGSVEFNNNSASNGSDGGALYIDNSSISFLGSVEFNNNRASSGAAAYLMNNSSLTISGQGSFTNNKADTNGAVFFVQDSYLTLKANSSDIVFSNNAPDGGFDIYLDGGANIVLFDISTRNAVNMDGGIYGEAGDAIEHKGGGAFNLKGKIDFAGNWTVNGGTMTVSYSTISISSFVINNARYSMKNPNYANARPAISARSARTVYAAAINPVPTPIITLTDSLTARNVIFDFSIYFSGSSIDGDKIIADTLIDINGAFFNFDAYGQLTAISSNLSVAIMSSSGTMPIINYNQSGYINWYMDGGDFRQLPFTLNLDSVNKTLNLLLSSTMSLSINNLTPNQKETQNLLNSVFDNNEIISIRSGLNLLSDNDIKETLDDISGVFIINALYIAAQKDMSIRLYDRLSVKNPQDFDRKANFWVQYIIDGGDYKDEESQVLNLKSGASSIEGGFDFLNNEDRVVGLYISQSADKIKQENNKADAALMGAGLYGIVYGGRVNFLFNAGADMGEIKTLRKIEYGGFEGDGKINMTIARGGAQIEFKTREDKIRISPYLGIDGIYAMTSKFEETGGALSLSAPAANFMRMDAKGGIKAAFVKDAYSIVGQVYAGYILNGDEIKYDMSFVKSPDSGKMSIRNSETGALYFGGAVGGFVEMFEGWKLFANAGVNINQNGNLGYSFRAGINISVLSATEMKANRIKREEERARKKEEERLAKEEAAVLKAQQEAQKQNEPQEKELTREEQLALLKTELEKIQEQKGSAVQEEQAVQQEYDAVRAVDASLPDAELLKESIIKAKERRANADIRVVKFNSGIFENGKYILTKQAKNEIWVLAQALKQSSYKSIVVEGHADSTGNPDKNMELSKLRAKAVYDIFVKCRLNNVEYVGFSSMLPEGDNNTIGGREKNRRIEIYIEDGNTTAAE